MFVHEIKNLLTLAKKKKSVRVFFFFYICMFTSVLGGCRARYTTAVQCLVKNTLPEIAAVGNRGAPYSLHRRFRKSTSQSRKVAARGGEPYNPLRDTSETATRRRHERHAKRQQIVSQEDFSKATMSYQQRQYPNLVSILSCFYFMYEYIFHPKVVCSGENNNRGTTCRPLFSLSLALACTSCA